MNKLEALRIASEHSGKSIDVMLSAAEEKGFHNREENIQVFYMLHQNNYIEGAFVLGLPVTITASGKNLLQQLQKSAEKSAKEERNNASNKKIAVCSLLVPFLVLVLQFVVDHYGILILQLFDSLWNWIKDVIQNAV